MLARAGIREPITYQMGFPKCELPSVREGDQPPLWALGTEDVPGPLRPHGEAVPRNERASHADQQRAIFIDEIPDDFPVTEAEAPECDSFATSQNRSLPREFLQAVHRRLPEEDRAAHASRARASTTCFWTSSTRPRNGCRWTSRKSTRSWAPGRPRTRRPSGRYWSGIGLARIRRLGKRARHGGNGELQFKVQQGFDQRRTNGGGRKNVSETPAKRLPNTNTSEHETSSQVRSRRLAEARKKGRHTALEWEVMVQICGSECVKCSSTDHLVKDHIVPIYQGGSDGIENLQPLCHSCNSSKGPMSEDLRPDGWQERLRNACEMATSQSQSPEERKDSSLRSESQRKSQGSRLPQGWSPTPEDIAFAQREGFTDDEIASIADDFTDYWIATPGSRGRKVDWSATWRTWIRRQHKPRGNGSGSGYSHAAKTSAMLEGLKMAAGKDQAADSDSEGTDRPGAVIHRIGQAGAA